MCWARCRGEGWCPTPSPSCWGLIWRQGSSTWSTTVCLSGTSNTLSFKYRQGDKLKLYGAPKVLKGINRVRGNGLLGTDIHKAPPPLLHMSNRRATFVSSSSFNFHQYDKTVLTHPNLEIQQLLFPVKQGTHSLSGITHAYPHKTRAGRNQLAPNPGNAMTPLKHRT